MIVALVAVALAIVAVARLPRTGSRPFALGALVASLLALDLFASAVIACAVTDACLH